VESGHAHVCACVLRGEPRDHVQCDAPRFCGIPSNRNIERQLIVSEEDAASTSIGSRECGESRHLERPYASCMRRPKLLRGACTRQYSEQSCTACCRTRWVAIAPKLTESRLRASFATH